MIGDLASSTMGRSTAGFVTMSPEREDIATRSYARLGPNLKLEGTRMTINLPIKGPQLSANGPTLRGKRGNAKLYISCHR